MYFLFITSNCVSVLISLSNRAGISELHFVFKARMFLLSDHKCIYIFKAPTRLML